MKNPIGLSPRSPLSKVAAEAEKAHIIKTLKSTNGNKTKAAEILGISRKTLWEKVKSYDIK
jgi:DNA-binding NtrC family response regulator